MVFENQINVSIFTNDADLSSLKLFERTPFERTPFERTPFERTPFERTPFERMPFERTPFECTPFECSPFERTLVQCIFMLFRSQNETFKK